ncbi:MAG: hypothetical protein HY925_12870 [Elusimicrobia bacterium]|nr:hypothetical protein [Elusimicrobiota bacterium]
MKTPERRHWLIPAAAFLLCTLVSAWSISRHFEGALTHEFCNYAEIGRNIVEGKGLKTSMVYPFTLALLDERGIEFDGLAPVLDRFPLQAVMAGFAERLGGPQDASLLILSALLLGLVAAGTSAAGLLLFGPAEASIGGALVALNPSFQRAFVLWGQPDFGFAALVLALTVLVATIERRGALGAVAAGGLAALAWMQRPNLSLWLPLFAFWLWMARGGARRLLLFAGTAAAGALPVMMYYWDWYGSLTPPTVSWNLAHHVIVDTPPWLHYRVFTAAECLRQSGALARKFWHFFFLQLRDLPTWWQMLLVSPASALGLWLLWRGEDEDARSWTRLNAAMLGVQLFAFSFLRFELLGAWVGGRYYLWAAPFLFLLAAHAAVSWGRRLERPRLVPSLFCAANAVVFLGGLFASQGPPAFPGGLQPADWPEIGAVGRLAAPDSLVATNLPGQVSWYARRASVALPAEPEDLFRIDEKHPIDTILISRLGLGELANTPGWLPLLEDLDKLRAFGARAHWVPVKDYGTAVLLVRARAARLAAPKPKPKRKRRT